VKLTRSEAMRLRHSVARVDGWLTVATAQDLANGLEWYDRARRIADDLAAESGLSVAPVRRGDRRLVAALPVGHQRGRRPDDGARRRRGDPQPVVGGVLSNREKAWRIAQGADPDDVLSGPKVCAFFANIMGDVHSVTVDVWAARAAEGRENPHAPKRRRYRLIAESYRRAGERRGMHPRDVQAAVWTVYRRTHGYQYDPAAA
jgi:hypothetical protein